MYWNIYYEIIIYYYEITKLFFAHLICLKQRKKRDSRVYVRVVLSWCNCQRFLGIVFFFPPDIRASRTLWSTNGKNAYYLVEYNNNLLKAKWFIDVKKLIKNYFQVKLLVFFFFIYIYTGDFCQLDRPKNKFQKWFFYVF